MTPVAGLENPKRRGPFSVRLRIVGAVRGSTIRGNKTCNSERKMAL